jgi:hypothetical protein
LADPSSTPEKRQRWQQLYDQNKQWLKVNKSGNPSSSWSALRVAEFSVNGQRTDSNYYLIDGVSANVGATAGSSFYSFASFAGVSGSVPPATALGTTQALVSVDALGEFRVQSSSYSAEFGRNPGGQFSFATRSGTNQWTGTAFDYLRNGYVDANDWFNDYLGVPQADFPVLIS